jgi:hypothetical protein
MVCVVNLQTVDVPLETGSAVGEVTEAMIQTRVCEDCGVVDTDAWQCAGGMATCTECSTPLVAGPSECRACGRSGEGGAIRGLSYAGCASCRPEAKQDVSQQGAATKLLSASISAFSEIHESIASGGPEGVSLQGAPADTAQSVNVTEYPIGHIVEEPGGIEHMADCEMPTEYYYTALAVDMKKRHPKGSAFVMEHVAALEPFLDLSIIAGFSYGINKAKIAVIQSELLGHICGRFGLRADGERAQAIQDFAPLPDASHVKMFAGSTNWIRMFLPAYYATAMKHLGNYLKPGAVFPQGGLGRPEGKTDGDKAVKAVKAMAKHCIETAVLDLASALDGTCGLEQVADACGIAWGSTNLQMEKGHGEVQSPPHGG